MPASASEIVGRRRGMRREQGREGYFGLLQIIILSLQFKLYKFFYKKI